MLFIAEIGLNHNGNLDLIQELVRCAGHAGADVAKLQLGWRSGEGELNRLEGGHLDRFIRWCELYDVEPMVSVFGRAAWQLARARPFPRFKIASRTVRDDPDLVREVAADGRETIISLGMWEDAGLPLEPASNVRYLWCRSEYPTQPWDLVGFPADFCESHYDGYSDHTIGIEVPLLAVSRGARIVEKHLTLDKSDTTIRDHALSATPEEFSRLVQLGKAMSRTLSAMNAGT